MTPPSSFRLARSAAGALVLALGAFVCLAPQAAAQEECEFLDGSGTFNMTTLSGGATVTFVSTPNMRCRDGVFIRADSVVSYSAQGMEHLIGNVRFRDASGTLRADEARYFGRLGRLQAEGNLFVQDTVQGYEIRNGRLVYLRATDFREQAQIDVTTGFDGVRPRAIVTMRPAPSDSVGSNVEADPADGAQPRDSAGAEPARSTVEVSADVPGAAAVPPPEERSNTPYTVDGDRIFIQGDTYFRATGNVEIERDSLHAFADSAEYDQVAGRMLLQGSARVDGPTYDLVGETINLGMQGDDIDEVVARRNAVLIGEDLRLTAPLIRMFLDGGALQRLVATAPAADGAGTIVRSAGEEGGASGARPNAVSDRFDLTADSIEVVAPAEVLERVFAAGRARSVSTARDSMNVEVLPEVARTDWLEGDTVIVTFLPRDSLAAVDPSDTTVAERRIDRIVARVAARSLYRLPPADSTAVPGVDPPAIHYVVGDEITIVMREGEVERMQVVGQTLGRHLEPLARPAAPDSLADSTAARDTAAAPASDARPRRRDAPREPRHPRAPDWEPPAISEGRT